MVTPTTQESWMYKMTWTLSNNLTDWLRQTNAVLLLRMSSEWQFPPEGKVVMHEPNYDNLANKYEKEMESYELEYSQKEVLLAADNDNDNE